MLGPPGALVVDCVAINFCTPPNTINSPRPCTIEYSTASSGEPLPDVTESFGGSQRTMCFERASLMSSRQRLIEDWLAVFTLSAIISRALP